MSVTFLIEHNCNKWSLLKEIRSLDLETVWKAHYSLDFNTRRPRKRLAAILLTNWTVKLCESAYCTRYFTWDYVTKTEGSLKGIAVPKDKSEPRSIQWAFCIIWVSLWGWRLGEFDIPADIAILRPNSFSWLFIPSSCGMFPCWMQNVT